MSLLAVIKSFPCVREVTPWEAYRTIFKLDDKEERCTQLFGAEVESRDLVANPVAYCKNDDTKRGHLRVMFFDTFQKELKWLQSFDFAIISGLSYFGKRAALKHASKLFALIIDLDGQTERTLRNFISGCFSEYEFYPLPNYVVLSGHGAHLYYVMEVPVSLYPNAQKRLRKFKYSLTRLVWNVYTSTEKDIQYQGIAQGFRVIGGKTKIPGYHSRVFQLNEHPWTLEALNEYLPEDERIPASEMQNWQKYQTTTPLSIAKKKWPDWYQRRVVEKLQKKSWTCSRRVYDWWRRRIASEASYGHRYFCIMCLAVFAVKCGVSKEELETDANNLIPRFNALSPQNPFTADDVKNALRCYAPSYATFPRDSIARISGIDITPSRQRKHNSQALHLKLARIAENDKRPDWRRGNGRKPKQFVVWQWRNQHPEGRKIDCHKDTGLSRVTIDKWWNKSFTDIRQTRKPLTPKEKKRLMEQLFGEPPETPAVVDASELEHEPL